MGQRPIACASKSRANGPIGRGRQTKTFKTLAFQRSRAIVLLIACDKHTPTTRDGFACLKGHTMDYKPLNINDSDKSTRGGPPGWLTLSIIFGVAAMIVVIGFVASLLV